MAQGHDEVVASRLEKGVAQGRAGREDLDDAAFQQFLALAGLLDLLAHGDPVTGLQQA